MSLNSTTANQPILVSPSQRDAQQQQLRQRLKKCAGRILINTCCVLPELRPWLKKWGLRTCKEWFGNKIVTVAVPTGQKFKLASASENYLSFELFWRGASYYEPISTMVALELIEPGATFIDAGANIGFYSLLLSTLRPNLKVVAFEPNPKNFGLLCRNFAANNFNRAHCEPLALSDSNGTSTLYVSASDMSASLEPEFDLHPTSAIQIARTTLDEYLEAHRIEGNLVIKVDVEGHEPAFFRGARRTLASLRPDIICEVTYNYAGETTAFLKKSGYRFYQITNRGLIESQDLTPVIHGPFVFLNYLLSTRPLTEIENLFNRIQPAVREIDLTETSKFVGTTMIQRFRERQESAVGES